VETPIITSDSPVVSTAELWGLLASVVFMIGFHIWVRLDADAHFKNRVPPAREEEPDEEFPDFDWPLLKEHAERIVELTVEEFPEEIRAQARRVPCLFLEWSGKVHHNKVLGLYHGFESNLMPTDGGNITLFLGNIFRFCDLDLDEFDEQVRITYLHELGHHFGWDEADLEERGLQ
jgi:predicted Zn-dependent protease with MMP-like domain